MVLVVPTSTTPAVAITDIDYTNIPNINPCPAQPDTTSTCYMLGNESDSVGIAFADCATSASAYCYSATVNDKPAPATLRFVAYMTAHKTHTASFAEAQFESNIVAFYLPPGGILNKSELWGWGKRPRNQEYGNGQVDLSPILSPSDVIKVTLKYRTPFTPQWSVLVANNGSMDFSMSGQELTLNIKGSPARVAIESAEQHINFDTEKNDDPSIPWANRCGFPSMRFVVCNVAKAESNPLLFYSRSSTFVNEPAASVAGPIWVSTNATYFHQPSVITQPDGKNFVEVKTAAPHFLSDGVTLNTATTRFFVPNAVLKTWNVDLTKVALDANLGVTETKDGVTRFLATTVEVINNGALITLPPTTYSSPTLTVRTNVPKKVKIKIGKQKGIIVKKLSELSTSVGVKKGKKPKVTYSRVLSVQYRGKRRAGCKWVKSEMVLQMPNKIQFCALRINLKDNGRIDVDVNTYR